MLPEVEQVGTFPVDEITKPTPCKLYVQDKIFKNKVATSQPWPGNDVIMHGRPLPLGCTKVTIDTVVKRRYHHTVELDIPGQDGKKLLRENMGFIVAWRKRYISFDPESDSDDDDADGIQDLHPPSSALERDPRPLP
jgi:hypothetical protein